MDARSIADRSTIGRVVCFSSRRRHSIRFRSGFFVVADDSEDRIAVGEDCPLFRNSQPVAVFFINPESGCRYLVHFIVPVSRRRKIRFGIIDLGSISRAKTESLARSIVSSQRDSMYRLLSGRGWGRPERLAFRKL